MTPGASGSRRKPVCHTCGELMAGHKRPNGSPICPRDSASPSPSRSRTQATTPTRAAGETTLLSRISPEDVRFSPTPSGYWRRQNPNWVEPAHYARIPTQQVPQRGDTIASWNSTELDDVSIGSLSQGERLSHGSLEDQVEDVDASDSEYADSLSAAPSSSFTRLTRRISKILGRSTPLASVYSAPSDEVFAIENAAQEHGLSTAVVRRPRAVVKAEPISPGTALDSHSRSTLTRESSWWVFVGRDRSAVDALAGSQARAAAAKPEREPYDYDTGLVKESNEGVGAYPVDPRTIRQNFCDVIIAAVVSAFCAVWLLSLM